MKGFLNTRSTFGKMKYNDDESVDSNKNNRDLTPQSRKSSKGYSNLSSTDNYNMRRLSTQVGTIKSKQFGAMKIGG